MGQDDPSGDEPCKENPQVTGDDNIEEKSKTNNNGPKADDDETKVEENTSPGINGHVSSHKSSAGGDEEPTAKSFKGLDPKNAWNEIKTQKTHCLYYCFCKSNITTDAELFKKGKETAQYKRNPNVIWIPLLFPSFLLSLFRRNTPVPVYPASDLDNPDSDLDNPDSDQDKHGSVQDDTPKTKVKPNRPPPNSEGLWEKLKNVFLNWLTFVRFVLVLVLLLIISVIVLLVLRKNDDKDLSLPTLMSIYNLPVIAALFLATLAVLWLSITVPYPDILHKYIVVPIKNLDIVKSIVYGGLIESITSLGVVSCAAGSGTSTLNVIALGIANLITGLILIIHKLCGLITNQPRYHNANNDNHVTDKQREALYKEMLGKPEKVKLHCVVVVVSFIFFGMIPPFFYGLSFKRNDQGLYKSAFVLSASLGCVMSLSFAKAYAFDMKKRWTVPVYTGMAIGASVLSFIASQFLGGLLEKFDFHDLASDCNKV